MAKGNNKDQYKVTERHTEADKYQRESWRRSANLLSDKAFKTAEDEYNTVGKEEVNPNHSDSDKEK